MSHICFKDILRLNKFEVWSVEPPLIVAAYPALYILYIIRMFECLACTVDNDPTAKMV